MEQTTADGQYTDRVEEFLDKYKQLEKAVRAVYRLDIGESPIRELKSLHRFGRNTEAIEYCREVRNFLQHTPKMAGAYAVIPSEQMVSFLDDLIAHVVERPRAFDIAVKAPDVISCAPTDTAHSVVTNMCDKGCSYVPVLVDGRVRGVFDKDSVFTWLAEGNGRELPLDTHISDLDAYTTLDGRRSEVFPFFAKDRYVDDVEDVFDEYSAKNQRVAVAFVTEHGEREERILGLLTAWDSVSARD